MYTDHERRGRADRRGCVQIRRFAKIRGRHADVANHADDLEPGLLPGRLAVTVAHAPDAPADRTRAAEVAASHRLVNQGGTRIRRPIAVVEIAPRKKWN